MGCEVFFMKWQRLIDKRDRMIPENSALVLMEEVNTDVARNDLRSFFVKKDTMLR